MSRKDFELIAATLRSLKTLPGYDAAFVASRFAESLAGENPRFDRERFIKAATK